MKRMNDKKFNDHLYAIRSLWNLLHYFKFNCRIARWCNKEEHCFRIWINNLPQPLLPPVFNVTSSEKTHLKGGFGDFLRPHIPKIPKHVSLDDVTHAANDLKKLTKPQCELCKYMLGDLARDYLERKVGNSKNKVKSDKFQAKKNSSFILFLLFREKLEQP